MLHVEGLCVSYGNVHALTDVSLRVEREQGLYGIIGPNGAGKSTLMDALSGRRRPSRGSIRLDGHEIGHRSVAWRRHAGMSRSFQRTSVFGGLTVREQFELIAHRLGEADLAAIVHTLALEDVLDLPAGSIAYGVQRRVDVALALIGQPRLLLLDEPGAGLSSAETLSLFHHLRELVRSRGIVAVVVEHDVDAVFQCCQQITVLDLGRVLATGLPEQVRAERSVISAYLGSAA